MSGSHIRKGPVEYKRESILQYYAVSSVGSSSHGFTTSSSLRDPLWLRWTMSDTKYAEIKETPVASTSRGRRERPLSPTLDEQMDVDDTNGVDADEDEEEDDDDPVVRRLPVYYTPEYIQSLCLLQYPDRPPRPETHHPLLPPTLEPDWQNDDSPAVGRLVAKYKPQTQHLEVTVPMEKDPERWNEDNAKRFATGVIEDKDKEREKDAQKKGGRRKKRDPAEDEAEQRYREEKEARRLDKMVYASTGVPEVTSYLIGVVRNGESASRRSSLRFADRPRAL